MRRAIERLRGRLDGIRRDERGTAALEFAIISPLFIALLLSFYDVGLLMLRQVMLTQAVDKTMREVRVSVPPMGLDQFISNVCDRAFILPDCKSTLVVDLRPVGKLAVNLPTDTAPCRDPQVKDMKPLMRYQPNNPGKILYVRVCAVATPLLPHEAVAPHLAKNLAGEVMIVSTTAFMGEQ